MSGAERVVKERMQAGRCAFGLALVAALGLGLSGCGAKDPHLMHFKSNNRGPDEFDILPTKPLQMPKDLSALPTPTPGGTNLTDPTPRADAVAALGGRAKALQPGAIPASDGALVTRAGRYGTDPNIRAELAAADLKFRQAHPGKPLQRLFGITTYFEVYKNMELDQHAELERWRAVGVRNESAPPPPDLMPKRR